MRYEAGRCPHNSPKVLHLHPDDNVALAIHGLLPGDVLELGGARTLVRQEVPSGHKVALCSLARGSVVRKYGWPIGCATGNILPGDHVHVHNIDSARGTERERDGGAALRIPSFQPPKPRSTHFLGYRRPDSRVGVRNHVLVLSGTQCANGVVERIGKALPDIVPLPHMYGCSQLGVDLEQTRRVLSAYASHPNVGACLLVGLGCESLPTREIAQELSAQGFRVRCLLIQEQHGTGSAVEEGLRIAQELLRDVANERRIKVSASELILGVECGASDSWSGVTANPAVGCAADIVVSLGGTVILAETTEFIGAEQLLGARATNPSVRAQLLDAVSRREAAARSMDVDLRGAQPTPGNMAGGLSTIEEKSLGAVTKGGTAPIGECVLYGCRPAHRGLAVMDTAGNDPESVTGIVAGGAQAVLFTTGRGTPAGNPIAPVIKVSSNTPLYESMRDDIDLDAGPMLHGEELSDMGQHIFESLIQVVSGKQACAEQWGHREFAIEQLGPKI